MRSHYESVQKQTGQPQPELLLPPFPHLAEGVWRKFLSAAQGRRTGLDGAEPLTYSDLESWKSATGWPLREWEVEAVMRLDRVWIAEMRKKDA